MSGSSCRARPAAFERRRRRPGGRRRGRGRRFRADNVPTQLSTDGGNVETEAVDRWLDAYVDAWKSYDRDAVAALFAVDVNVAVATGASTYLTEPGGEVDKIYDNCYVIRFDDEGRCREFTEWFMERPSPKSLV